MRSREVPSTRFNLAFYSQWKDLLGKNNWYDFTVFNLSGEYSPYAGSAEFNIGVLGLNWTLTYTYDFGPLDEMVSLKDKVLAELEAEHPGTEVIDPFNVLDELDNNGK